MSEMFRAAQLAASAALRTLPAEMSRSYAPPPPPSPAIWQGQREIVAATLAAGMIAAEGRTVTVAEAVEQMRLLLAEAWPG